jgi:hypothetical protein
MTRYQLSHLNPSLIGPILPLRENEEVCPAHPPLVRRATFSTLEMTPHGVGEKYLKIPREEA